MKIGIVILLSMLVNYVIITTIANSLLMGALHFHFSMKCRKKKVIITKANRIDLQNGYQCSAFSSAYILRHWLHYVPVVGYDEHYIFVAESLAYLVNSNEQYYNRKISINEFKKLWNTSMLKMPFYRNTYYSLQIDNKLGK